LPPLQRFFNAGLLPFEPSNGTQAMEQDELVFALAVCPATSQQCWHARLVCADGGTVMEFDTLNDLVRYLAQASFPGPAAPLDGIR
jgi:hypothetical protein